MTPMTQKDEKIREILRELAAEYFSRESNRQSLITVTGVEVTGKGSKATILLSVLPVSAEEAALDFAHRQLTDLREYVEEHSRISRVPFLAVAIDKGEKNRQMIDGLSN